LVALADKRLSTRPSAAPVTGPGLNLGHRRAESREESGNGNGKFWRSRRYIFSLKHISSKAVQTLQLFALSLRPRTNWKQKVFNAHYKYFIYLLSKNNKKKGWALDTPYSAKGSARETEICMQKTGKPIEFSNY